MLQMQSLPRSGPQDRLEDHGDAALGTDVRGAQETPFAVSCKALLFHALSLIERRSAAFALPTFVQRAAILKPVEP